MLRHRKQHDDEILTIDCPANILQSPYPPRKRFKKTSRIIIIRNCESLENAINLLSSAWFCFLKKHRWPGLIAIKLEVKQIDSNAIQSPKAKDFDKKSRIILSFEANDDKIIFWKNENSTVFHKLELFKAEGHSAYLIKHVLNFFIVSFKTNYEVNMTSQHGKLVNLKNSNGYNLLMQAVEMKAHDVIMELLKLPFDLDLESVDGAMAIDIAWKNKDPSAIELLLEANSKYPKEFTLDQLPHRSKNIRVLVNATTKLQNIIKEGDINAMDAILNQHPKVVYFYDTKNMSASAYALKLKKIDFYLELRNKGRFLGQHETKFLKPFHLTKNGEFIRNKHTLMANETDPHIGIILSYCIVSHDDQNAVLRNQFIYNALQKINNFKFIKSNGESVNVGRILLKLIATLENYKIHFDFNRPSVEMMNPYEGDSKVNGLFNSKLMQIYIGAKGLLKDETMHIVIGVMIHELHHLVLELVFRNKGNPYAIEDENRKNKFEEIIQHSKNLKNEENIIARVFSYKKNDWPSELIVRPPQMMAFYTKQPNKLVQLRETFIRLFKYYEKFVVPQMERTLVDLERLTKSDENVIFSELTEAHKNVICQEIVKFQGENVELGAIAENNKNSVIFNFLKSKQLRYILNNRLLIENKNNHNIIRIGETFDENKDYIEREFELENRKRKFADLNNNQGRKVFSFNDIKKEALEKRIIILSDQAGSGKSTTFENLCVKLKKEFKTSWVSYIDLKRHLNVFESSDHNHEPVEILLKILNLTEGFEIEIFKKLFQSNKIILLFDAVDEIAPNFEEFFMKLVEKIKEKTKNIIWISTRPHHSEKLMEKYRQDAFKLRPWIKKQKEELIKKVLKNKNQILKKKKIDEIFKFFRTAISETSIRNLDNPLMIKILTEMYIENPTNLHNMSTYQIYQHIFEKKTKIWITRNNKIAISESNPETKLNIWQVHQVFALKVIFNDKGFNDYLNDFFTNQVNLSEFAIIKKWNNNQSLSTRTKWTINSITRHGILLEKKNNINFSHRTFAEFFLTKYFIENIFEEDDEEVSDGEVERRIKMLVYLIITEDSTINFIEGYFEDPTKRLVSNEKIAKFICDDKLKLFWQRFLKNSSTQYLKLLKCFYYDEKIIKALSVVNNSIIILKYFSENLQTLLTLFEFYRIHFENNWHDFIPYKLNHSKLNGQTVYEKLQIVERKFIDMSLQNEQKNFEMCKSLLAFLTFISFCEIPLDELTLFLSTNFKYIISTFNIPIITESIFEIIVCFFSREKDIIFTKLKDPFMEIYNMILSNSESTEKQKKNIKNFKIKLQSFLAPEYNMNIDTLRNQYLQSAATSSYQNQMSPNRTQPNRII